MKRLHRTRPAVPVVGGLAVLLLTACGYRPATPQLTYELNVVAIEENPDLDNDPAALERLRGALEFLFGTPSAPSYLDLPEWADEEFQPDYWGQDSLSDEQYEALRASNREHFVQQIAAIEAGDFDAVREPRYSADLQEQWWDHLSALEADYGGDPDAPLDPEDPEAGTWRDEGVALFEYYYPTLSTSAEFYRQQCFHCHGSEGGGDGSTAEFLNPRPRDYRPGVFKFTGLNNKARPRHEDLFRILTEGVYTSAMPTFRRFSDAQLHGLADYVRLLSIRGETEILMATDFDPDEGLHFENLQENYELVVDRWRANADELIVYEGEVPPSTPEAIAHGRALYLSEKGANCVKCHGESGRGDGPSVADPENSTDDWGNPIAPRDLNLGVFRFGRRPIDIYRRVYAGINGTPMPAHYGMQITEEDGTQRPLDENDVWDLVHYVRSLSSHPMDAPSTPSGPSGH